MGIDPTTCISGECQASGTGRCRTGTALTRSPPRLPESIIAAVNSRSSRGTKARVNRLWRKHAELHTELVQKHPSLRRHSYQSLIMLEIKAQQISAPRFRLLNYPVVLRFRVDREGGIFPSISVKIDLRQARKHLLLCKGTDFLQIFHSSGLFLFAYSPSNRSFKCLHTADMQKRVPSGLDIPQHLL